MYLKKNIKIIRKISKDLKQISLQFLTFSQVDDILSNRIQLGCKLSRVLYSEMKFYNNQQLDNNNSCRIHVNRTINILMKQLWGQKNISFSSKINDT